MSSSVWLNVGVSMQSALAAPVVINTISKANPAVVGYAGVIDPANLDRVLVQSAGMTQVNGRVFRVANVNAAGNTFELEGVDSTLFDTHVSGSFQVATLNNSFGTIRQVSGSGGDPDEVDDSVIHDDQASILFGRKSPIKYQFEHRWDVSNPALLAMKTASDFNADRVFEIRFSNGQVVYFNGAVSASLAPLGSTGQLVTTSTQITVRRPFTFYAS